MFKNIYLSVHYSHVGLNYDNIYTILLPFVKNFPLLFSPLELYSWSFLFILLSKKFIIIMYKVITNTFAWNQLAISIAWLQSLILKFFNLIMYWILSHHNWYILHIPEGVWLWCEFFFSLSFLFWIVVLWVLLIFELHSFWNFGLYGRKNWI